MYCDSLFQFLEAPPFRRPFREQHPAHIFERVFAFASHHDLVALFVPFDRRSGADAELPANLGGNRNPAPRVEFGLSDGHTSHYQRNAIYFWGPKPFFARNSRMVT